LRRMGCLPDSRLARCCVQAIKSVSSLSGLITIFPCRHSPARLSMETMCPEPGIWTMGRESFLPLLNRSERRLARQMLASRGFWPAGESFRRAKMR
jgi:hypothetical protein